jgi:hypothetical protein
MNNSAKWEMFQINTKVCKVSFESFDQGPDLERETPQEVWLLDLVPPEYKSLIYIRLFRLRDEADCGILLRNITCIYASFVFMTEPNPESRSSMFLWNVIHIHKTAWSHKLEDHKLSSESHLQSRRSCCRFEPVTQECNSNTLQLIIDKPILSSQRMLHKNYDRKGLV